MQEISLSTLTTTQLYEALEGHAGVIQLYTRELEFINGYEIETPYSNCLLDLRDIEVSDYELLKEELIARGETLTEEQIHLTSGIKPAEVIK